MIELPALEYLMGCYFHEDYAEVHGSPEGAVDDFVRMDRHQAERVGPEIESLISQTGDADLAETLWDYGLAFNPLARGWTSHRGWLLAVAAQIEDRLKKPGSG